MREKRIAAVLMSVFMILSLLPSTVFAAGGAALDGKLKIKGTAAVGSTLSADFTEVKPEGLDEDSVSYVWARVTEDMDGETEKSEELGREKTYTVVQEDLGAEISLTISGMEDKGFSGTLKAVTDKVITAEEAALLAEQETDASSDSQTETGTVTEEPVQEVPEDTPSEDDTWEETGTENGQEILYPAEDPGIYEEYTEYGEGEEAGSEAVGTIPAASEDGTWTEESQTGVTEESAQGAGPDENGNDQELSYQAEAEADDGSGTVDFGAVISGAEDSVESRCVTVTNTGTGTLHFSGISPEHFAVQDITEPLEPGESISLWVVPRAGVEPGTYEDVITYSSEEGAQVSYTAKMTVEEAETTEDIQEQPQEDQEETGGEQDTPQDEAAALVTDTESLTFENGEARKVTVTNNSDGDITIQVSVTAGTVTVTPSDPVTLTAGASCEYQVVPVETGLEPGKEYDDTVIFADTDGKGYTVSVPVKIVTEEEEPAVSSIASDREGTDFGTALEGYTETPEAQTVILTNSGTADAEIIYYVNDKDEAQYFDVSLSDSIIARDGGTVSFTIRPKTGLPAGVYEEYFTVQDKVSGTEIPIRAGFTVEAASHSLTVSPASLDFASVKEGYGEIEAQQFTVTNSGNTAETLVQPSGTNFEVSSADAQALTLQPGDSVSFTVRPKSGLGVNSYQETISIASANAGTALQVSFQVVKATVTVTEIINPSAVTGLANGTPKNKESLKLPSTVVIRTAGGNMKASVVWDIENCSYDPSSVEAQNFRIRGAVTLPDGVDNNNNLTLAAYVQVSVNAYSPRKASADDNRITGIEYNGNYTTQSRISFTAIGAGMDNTSPRKGDTRYVPLHWKVINTNTWTGSPYTATFGLAQSGDYTLKVNFRLQQYNGSSWTDTDQYDTKQVPFSISKANVTAPGLDLTPAANRRNAVKTGDSTPIVSFVVILVAAVAVIGGILVYRTKKK